jgi:hypothetical protein
MSQQKYSKTSFPPVSLSGRQRQLEQNPQPLDEEARVLPAVLLPLVNNYKTYFSSVSIQIMQWFKKFLNFIYHRWCQ